MQHRHVIETVDHTLRDIMNKTNIPFGGIPVAWGGDFQQTLPVVKHGNREDIVNACLQKSPLWRHVKILHLTENMCVEQDDPQSIQFADWLLRIGSGTDLPEDNKIQLPPHMVTESDQ